MEIPAPSSLEASGGGGEESAAPTRNGVSGQTGDALEGEGDGDKGVESVAMESDGADPGAAAPQIHEPRPDRKTCHQCRQGKSYFGAACKVEKKYGLCKLRYCRKCLINRYGESEDAVELDDSWACPKCRGECNCSNCRKMSGKTPTGILSHAARAVGCSSVHDLLNKGDDEVAAAQKLVTPLTANRTSKKKRNRDVATDDATGTNGLLAEGDDQNAVSSVPTKKKKKVKCTVDNRPADDKSLQGTESLCAVEEEIVLPRGTPITNVAGADLEEEDVGPALQFYEFCRSFAEFFHLRKGEPEKILQEISGGRELRVVASLIAELHIKLFSIIKQDRGEKPPKYSRDGDQWIIDIGKYISGSTFISKELPLDCLNQGVSGYKILSPSYKLHVLNFLCDETLSCAKLRNWIDKKNEKASERKSVAKEKIRAANEKERELKGRQSDMAKDALFMEGETTTIMETNNLISEVKEANEVKRAATNALEEVGGVQWTKPVMVDKGVAYWKLDGYCDNATIMRQELDSENMMGNKDKWFMFTEDEEKVIVDHMAKRSRGRFRKRTGV
ncbi:uncharacterized protein [Lolium perenne]|uniref:uncharacterized protein isoform X1 n=1 Tax=Lolium perenne TaxID=4522 RepID=UPI0021F57119|nr:uncharacterized protein LOC127308452 isoform X1 [Lolium perenne]